ncbi:MAG: hypothetical protein MJB57_00235, partial [Gemmatimonadetes bacterium]|nr:hypothetical protein [Gemmatimonadota bacterium]
MSAPRVSTGRAWPWLQRLGLVATGGLLLGLVIRPELTLRLLWDVAIPLVPASLLLSPLVWRNVCPLATVNMAGNRFGARRRASPAWTTRANVVGIVLFAALVPARRFLLNDDGAALA